MFVSCRFSFCKALNLHFRGHWLTSLQHCQVLTCDYQVNSIYSVYSILRTIQIIEFDSMGKPVQWTVTWSCLTFSFCKLFTWSCSLCKLFTLSCSLWFSACTPFSSRILAASAFPFFLSDASSLFLSASTVFNFCVHSFWELWQKKAIDSFQQSTRAQQLMLQHLKRW